MRGTRTWLGKPSVWGNCSRDFGERRDSGNRFWGIAQDRPGSPNAAGEQGEARPTEALGMKNGGFRVAHGICLSAELPTTAGKLVDGYLSLAGTGVKPTNRPRTG